MIWSVNLGLRYDYIDTDTKTLINPTNPPVIQSLETLPGSRPFGPTRIRFIRCIPRLGLAFPITERTVFYTQYGKFVQMPLLRSMYGNRSFYGANMVGGNALYYSRAGADLEPIRSTQYEIGYRQQIGSSAAFSIVAYYKNIKNQLNFAYVIADPQSEIRSYPAYVNDDFVTNKGFEVGISLRRIHRVQMRINYTLASPEGSASDRYAPPTKECLSPGL